MKSTSVAVSDIGRGAPPVIKQRGQREVER